MFPNIHVLTQQVVSYSGQACIVTLVLIVSCLANLELTLQDAVLHNPAAQIPSASVSALREGSPVTPTQRIWKGASGSANLHSDSEHTGGWGRSPDLGVGWKRISDASAVTEVHLRRLDSTDTLHRRVVAVLTVDATPEEASPVLYSTMFAVSQKQAVAKNVNGYAPPLPRHYGHHPQHTKSSSAREWRLGLASAHINA